MKGLKQAIKEFKILKKGKPGWVFKRCKVHVYPGRYPVFRVPLMGFSTLIDDTDKKNLYKSTELFITVECGDLKWFRWMVKTRKNTWAATYGKKKTRSKNEKN